MLLRERLGRCHQSALPARFDRPQQRVERDDGLPRADVTLEQPFHRDRPDEIRVDLGDCTLLIRGQPEGQDPSVALDQLAGRRERRGDVRGLLGTPPGKTELEHEQLVEREP